jgi:hypothetical protein
MTPDQLTTPASRGSPERNREKHANSVWRWFATIDRDVRTIGGIALGLAVVLWAVHGRADPSAHNDLTFEIEKSILTGIEAAIAALFAGHVVHAYQERERLRIAKRDLLRADLIESLRGTYSTVKRIRRRLKARRSQGDERIERGAYVEGMEAISDAQLSLAWLAERASSGKKMEFIDASVEEKLCKMKEYLKGLVDQYEEAPRKDDWIVVTGALSSFLASAAVGSFKSFSTLYHDVMRSVSDSEAKDMGAGLPKREQPSRSDSPTTAAVISKCSDPGAGSPPSS